MGLMQAENFKANWYGWITNQSTHALFGAIAYLAVCAAWFHIAGEYPIRILAWLVVALSYFVWEYVIQHGRHFWDSLEDWVFWAGHGAGVMALTLNEVTPGLPDFTGRVTDILPMVGFFLFHCVCGVVIRIWQEDK